ncbi:MAG: hypothetical protein AMXMBFR64_32980 [Myxococcales bacterium]
MSDAILIDAVRPEDREVVADLFLADLDTVRVRKTRAEVLAVIDSLIEGTRPHELFWAARTAPGGRPLGALLATVVTSVKHGGRALWLEQLFVDGSARRMGAGRAMVERLLSWCRENGVVGIDLESYQLNAPASCLYRSLGFRRLGRERFTIDLTATDA